MEQSNNCKNDTDIGMLTHWCTDTLIQRWTRNVHNEPSIFKAELSGFWCTRVADAVKSQYQPCAANNLTLSPIMLTALANQAVSFHDQLLCLFWLLLTGIVCHLTLKLRLPKQVLHTFGSFEMPCCQSNGGKGIMKSSNFSCHHFPIFQVNLKIIASAVGAWLTAHDWQSIQFCQIAKKCGSLQACLHVVAFDGHHIVAKAFCWALFRGHFASFSITFSSLAFFWEKHGFISKSSNHLFHSPNSICHMTLKGHFCNRVLPRSFLWHWVEFEDFHIQCPAQHFCIAMQLVLLPNIASHVTEGQAQSAWQQCQAPFNLALSVPCHDKFSTNACNIIAAYIATWLHVATNIVVSLVIAVALPDWQNGQHCCKSIGLGTVDVPEQAKMDNPPWFCPNLRATIWFSRLRFHADFSARCCLAKVFRWQNAAARLPFAQLLCCLWWD